MVAHKLILHSNCFCCKHCNKKLSIHNYSAIYGELYCPSHYHQLFKKKGNYDEGFGHRQHKDRWKENKIETKTDSKRSDMKPRNLLGRLFSSSKTESEINKMADIKIETVRRSQRLLEGQNMTLH
uniref:LIM zinc-binding domain-containing protein n=1 Tax=Cyprinus carpio TaxID=7962 RepID=A0A8C1SMJ9_CYPCA